MRRKFGEVRTCGFRVMPAARYTDKQTHYNTLHPSRGRNNQMRYIGVRLSQGKITVTVCGYYRSRLWYIVLSVCRLSSVTVCIVAKRYVLAKICLKEQIGNRGQKVEFLSHRHISTSGFASTATEMAVFALFLPVQPSNRY